MPVQLQIKTSTDLVRQGLEDLDKIVPKVGRRRIFNTMRRAQKLVKEEPGAFQGKFPYVSEKQRRFVMWAIRKGIIKVPYKRTGRYSQGWNVSRSAGGRGYVLRNRWAHARYVGGSAYGTGQARIHQGRWPLLRDAVEKAMTGLPKKVADDITIVARRIGFRAK